MIKKCNTMTAYLSSLDTVSTRLYEQSTPVFKIGDKADSVYYVQEGKITITAISEEGKEAMIGIISTGQFFGQSVLTGQKSRIANAVPLEKTATVISLKADIVLNLLASNQNFASAFMHDLLERTDQIEADLTDQLFNSSERRLARVLLLLAHYGNGHKEPQPILGEISQDTLAKKVGTTRSRVSYFMNKFRKLGFLSYNGGIHVHPSLLNAVLHEFPGDRIDGDGAPAPKPKKAKPKHHPIDSISASVARRKKRE